MYDSLGGGKVTETIISHLPPKSHYFLYGMLEGKAFKL